MVTLGRGAADMNYISAILENVVPIISEASKSTIGLISLVALIVFAIVLLFLYLTAQARPFLSFVLALVAIMLMFGGVVGFALSTPDISPSPIVYDIKRLQKLKEISFKVPNLQDKNTTDYNLLDGKLQRQPDETWQELQQHADGLVVPYPYKQTHIIQGQITYRRPDNSIELVVFFPDRRICWRETVPDNSVYHCPYALVSFE
jgi:hypothetical protein